MTNRRRVKNLFKRAASAESIRHAAAGHDLLRILHVDDDLNQLMFTKLFLEECGPGISVESVLIPSEAVDVVEAEEYDCVVSDYQMSDMDGITLTHRLRERSDIPIIIYTGRGSDEVEKVARAAGADGYVQKETDPTHYKGLYAQILDVVHEKMMG
ncbi:MAG: response regulator [Candidatus Bathyarchaeota archaeon]|nr:response regulator [Candidatus Bathyarchaeota archaeon]